jgi:hypothetical protein
MQSESLLGDDLILLIITGSGYLKIRIKEPLVFGI